MRNLKQLLVLCSLVMVCTIILANGAWAQGTPSVGGTSVMSTAATKAIQLFKNVKGIIFIVGAFGLVGIAFQAIFGKVKWSWFAGLAVGLGILAAADAIITYATGDVAGAQAGGEGDLQDTFGNSAGQ